VHNLAASLLRKSTESLFNELLEAWLDLRSHAAIPTLRSVCRTRVSRLQSRFCEDIRRTEIPRPNLILLDLMMSRMNGWEFLQGKSSDLLIAIHDRAARFRPARPEQCTSGQTC
jgi:CheY-like chemotaxis protein